MLQGLDKLLSGVNIRDPFMTPKPRLFSLSEDIDETPFNSSKEYYLPKEYLTSKHLDCHLIPTSKVIE